MSGKPLTKIEASMSETKKKAKERASSFKHQVAAYQATNQPKRVIGSTTSKTDPGALIKKKLVKTFPPDILGSSIAANKTKDHLGPAAVAAEARMIRSGRPAIKMRLNTKDNINWGGPKRVNTAVTNLSVAAPGRTRSGLGKKKRRRTRKKRKRRKTRRRRKYKRKRRRRTNKK